MRQIDLPHRHVSCTVDLDAPGIQHGHIWLPDAGSATAWRRTPVPICVINSGEGATVTCIGGVHGDEFEGPLTLLGLAKDLTMGDIKGRLILLPALSAVALQHGQRSVNNELALDSMFLTEHDAQHPPSTSRTLADYLEQEILPRSYALIDLRAGGGTLNFTPFAAIYDDENTQRREAAEACMIAFGAPFSMRWPHPPIPGSLGSAAQRTDTVYVQAEMGGGSSVSRTTLATTRIGVENALVHLGVSNRDFRLRSSRMVTLLRDDRMIYAPSDGLIELHRELGADVYRGNSVACIVDPLRTGVTPELLISPVDGILLAHRHGGIARAGDCIALIGDEMSQ